MPALAQSPFSDLRFTKLLSTEELDWLCTPFVPQQTKSKKFPVDILQAHYEASVVDQALAAFVLEAKRMDGNYYPGTTIRNILSAIHRVMKANLGAVNVKSFIDKKERERFYPQLNSALDRQLRMLQMNGIGVGRKRAQVITPGIEQQLWIKGILGLHSPQSLLNTVFFYNGKNLCLREIQENFNLKFSQLHRTNEPDDKYVYTGLGSKNRHGGINDLSEGKVVSIAATGR